MKKLSVEEKAMAYDSLFERLKEMYNNNKANVITKLIFERYFPELKESKDEEIRKALMKFIEAFPYERLETNGVSVKETLAWLEKQGE